MTLNFSALVGLVSACTALVASIVGPVVALAVARRQFNATVISSGRQKWIEAMRDALAELVALISSALIVKSNWKEKWESGRGPLNSDPVLLDKFEHIVRAETKIHLLITPTDPDHQRLVEAIEDAIQRLRLEESQDAATERDIRAITALAQAIFRRGWERVKEGT